MPGRSSGRMRRTVLGCALVWGCADPGAITSRPDGGVAPAIDAAGASPDAPGGDGDIYLPWEGGPAYYAAWSHGLPTDPNFFPIAVFWQNPANAEAFAAIGINTYIG